MLQFDVHVDVGFIVVLYRFVFVVVVAVDVVVVVVLVNLYCSPMLFCQYRQD